MAARSLRAVSLAITLISIVTVSTVAYSAFQEYSFITGPAFGSVLQSSSLTSSQGSTFSLEVNGSIPNNGMYPIQLELGLSLFSDGQLLSNNQSGAVTFPPGASQHFTISESVDVLGSYNASELAKILLNGTEFQLQTNATVRLEPFAGISISANSSVPFSPVFGNLSIGTATTSGGSTALSLPLSFANGNSFDFSCQMYGELQGSSGTIATFTPAPVVATAGQETSLTLLAAPGQPVPPGNYQLVLYVSTPQATVPIHAEVTVA